MIVSKMKVHNTNTDVDSGEVFPTVFFIRADLITPNIPRGKINNYRSWLGWTLGELNNNVLYGCLMSSHVQGGLIGNVRILSTEHIGFTVPRQGVRMDPSGSILSVKVDALPGLVPIHCDDGKRPVMPNDVPDIVMNSPGAYIELHIQDEAGHYQTPTSIYRIGGELDSNHRLVGVDIVFPDVITSGGGYYNPPHPTAGRGHHFPVRGANIYQTTPGMGTPVPQCNWGGSTSAQFGGTVEAIQQHVPPNYQNPPTHPTEPRVGDVVVPAEQNLRSRGEPEGADDKVTGPADPTIDQPKE